MHRAGFERRLLFDRVAVTATDARALHVTGIDEVGDDLVRAALADADRFCDLPNARIRIARDAEKDNVRGE